MSDIRFDTLPKARTEKLIVKELPDETLVYDLETDQAHCLNRTAAIVWKNCDGAKPVGKIQAVLEDEAGAPVDQAVVWLALNELEKFKLLDQITVQPPVLAGLNRRQLMRAMSVAAIAMPVIISIVAPTAAQAVSCPDKTPSGGTCNGNGNCCSGSCVSGVCA